MQNSAAGNDCLPWVDLPKFAPSEESRRSLCTAVLIITGAERKVARAREISHGGGRALVYTSCLHGHVRPASGEMVGAGRLMGRFRPSGGFASSAERLWWESSSIHDFAYRTYAQFHSHQKFIKTKQDEGRPRPDTVAQAH